MAQVSALSPLVSLPTEVMGMVVENIPCLRDLSQLCLTCKIWNGVAKPKLYADLYITIPDNNDVLTSLELLLGSANGNLMLVSSVHVVPYSDPGEGSKSSYSSCGRRTEYPIQKLSKFGDSQTFITLLRLLLRRIPKGTLKRFFWAVNRTLDRGTVALLIQLHGSSLVALQCDESRVVERFSAVPNKLQALHVHNLALGKGFSWVAALLATNRDTMSKLTIGDEKRLLHEYYRPGGNVNYEDSTSGAFLTSWMEEVSGSTKSRSDILNLDKLRLISLDFTKLSTDSEVQCTDFSNLTTLVLESCKNCPRLFSLLMCSTGAGSSKSFLTRLRAFTIRHEAGPANFKNRLQTFLCRLQPLTKLCIMLESCFGGLNLCSVLKIHGAKLRCLIWDERYGRRVLLSKCQTFKTAPNGHLLTIAGMCSNLVELGITVEWDSRDYKMDELQQKMIRGIATLKELKTLNIRNMPEIHATRGIDLWLSPDTLYHGLGSSLIEKYIRNRMPSIYAPKLDILAFGALTHRDVWEASGFSNSGELDLATAFRLRIFHIKYKFFNDCFPTPTLTRVATGSASAIGHISEDLSIFEPYWLG